MLLTYILIFDLNTVAYNYPRNSSVYILSPKFKTLEGKEVTVFL